MCWHKANDEGPIDASQSTSCLELLSRLSIEVDAETHRRALHEVLFLARTENLTTYDAAYLELAMRRGPDWPPATKRSCEQVAVLA